jgi:hypothetical protein
LLQTNDSTIITGTTVTNTAFSFSFSAWIMEQHKQPSVVLSMVSDRYYGILLPWCYSIATTLELPAWELYKKAWATCANDAIAAASSSYRLGYLTLKPVAILCWIMLGKFWKFVLEHGGNSLQTGAIHLKSACFHFYRFQISLNGTQLLGEACLVLMCVGLYYLRKWLQRQMYWAKLVKWYRAKKRRLGQVRYDKIKTIRYDTIRIANPINSGNKTKHRNE